MIKILVLILVIWLITCNCCFSQKEDYNWMLGEENRTHVVDSNAGVTKISFENEQVSLSRSDAKIVFCYTNSLISDFEGRSIQLASNGFQVYNKYGIKLPNENQINKGCFQHSETGCMLVYQAAIILPIPIKPNNYFIIYLCQDYPKPDTFVQMNKLLLASVDASANGGQGYMEFSDSLIMAGAFEFGKLTVCRHANGRDWWLVIPRRYSNQMFVFLIDPTGVHLHRSQLFNSITHTGIGMASFSPDGNHYAIGNTDGNDPLARGFVEIYNFDRCEGLIYNKRELPVSDTATMSGLAFSTNSKYLYYNTNKILRRLDVTKSNLMDGLIPIDTFDSNYSDPFTCVYGPSMLAPDGMIYMVPNSGSRCASRINHPDADDPKDINFGEYSIRLPTYNFKSIPNMPHFRLGPIDGSICDSLGIDNVPMARFRFETIPNENWGIRFFDLSAYEPSTWLWDFGDPASSDNTSNLRNPNHEFSKSGIFEVCLTVRNNFGEDKQCKTVEILTVDNKDILEETRGIYLFPNPVLDELHIQLKENVGPWKIQLLNPKNELIQNHQGKNTTIDLNLENLSAGVYILKLQTGKSILVKRFVKM
ncbi:MAG: T9SS type A sorting domain-containing protein [Saprospiraceae bacterium]|jgi:hypothetical protein